MRRNGASEKLKLEYAQEILHRKQEDELFSTVFVDFPEYDQLESQPRNFDCLRGMINTKEENCTKFSDYSLKFVRYFAHACETRSEEEVNTFKE